MSEIRCIMNAFIGARSLRFLCRRAVYSDEGGLPANPYGLGSFGRSGASQCSTISKLRNSITNEGNRS